MSGYQMMKNVARRYGYESDVTIAFCVLVESGVNSWLITTAYNKLMGERR